MLHIYLDHTMKGDMSEKNLIENARNEAIKLQAAYYNNSAVGLGLAGVLIPCLTIAQRLVEMQ